MDINLNTENTVLDNYMMQSVPEVRSGQIWYVEGEGNVVIIGFHPYHPSVVVESVYLESYIDLPFGFEFSSTTKFVSESIKE